MRRLFGVLTIFALLVPALAGATPPRAIWVAEVILGQTDRHLYVLHRRGDNLGAHHVLATDVLLVRRDLATGADDAHWPVTAQMDYGRDHAELGEAQRIVREETGAAIDPFTVLADAGAYNLVPAEADAEMANAAMAEGALEVRMPDGTLTHRMPLDVARKHVFATLAAAAAESPERTPVWSTAGYPDPPADFEEFCRAGPAYLLEGRPGAPFFAVRLDCQDDVYTYALSVYVILPLVTGNQ